MKKYVKRYSIVAVVLLLAMVLTSCLTILGGILGGVDTFFKFVDSFYNESLPDNAVYGSTNNLAVGFDSGKLVAFWDYDSKNNYLLDVTRDGKTQSFVAEEQQSVLFDNGKFALKDAGYEYSDNLSLALTVQNAEKSTVFYYEYYGLDSADYNKYTKNAGGFDTIDYYLSTRYELFEFFSFLIIFRPDAVFTNTKKESYYSLDKQVYLGYDFMSLYSDVTRQQAFENEIFCAVSAFEDSAAYNYGYEINGNIASLRMRFYYDVDPTMTTNSYTTYTNNVRPTEKPHYTIEKTERIFAIDSREKSVTVKSTDQLYFAIKKGYKPDCPVGSNAYYIYNRMRYVLSEIISDEDSQATKVHYIYDYLVDTVIYDYDFVSNTLDSSKHDVSSFTYKCLYMEGVFGYEKGQFNAQKRMAICDGLSKAFLCMTQIEGIVSIKVSGTAGNEAHAWNKVQINGNWYLVDTTWGNKKEGKREYLSHEYLMVADDSKHVEDKWYYYPKAENKYHFILN